MDALTNEQSQEEARQKKIADRARVLYKENHQKIRQSVDRLFGYLMLGQWVFAIALAFLVSPYAWAGKTKIVHLHIYLAVFLGGAMSLFPFLLSRLHPGRTLTRHVMAATQMLWSALLIHLSGGRIETHFHVFGSLSFVLLYLDWKVITTATVVVATDHFLRGVLWPESVYGIANPEWWRFLEHAGWVVFQDIVLLTSCVVGVRELKALAERRAEVEAVSESDQLKAAALEMALAEVRGAHRK